MLETASSGELLSQPHMEYPGYRTTLKTSFGKMKDKIHVDVGIGDVVEPQNKELKLFEYRGKPFICNVEYNGLGGAVFLSEAGVFY